MGMMHAKAINSSNTFYLIRPLAFSMEKWWFGSIPNKPMQISPIRIYS
jgi:hypothetical protein